MVWDTRAWRGAGAFFTATAIAGGLLLGSAGSASAAAPAACDATALGLSVLGAPAIRPIEANAGSTPCVAASGSINLPALAGTLSAQLVSSTTSVASGTNAAASSQVAGLDIGGSQYTSALTTPLTSGVNSILGSVSGSIAATAGSGGALNTALAPLRAVGLTVTGVDNGELAADIAPRLPAALDDALPSLVQAGVLSASASATCSAGKTTLGGESQLTDVRVLGTLIDPNDPAGKVLSLDTANLTLSQLVSVNDVLRSIRIQSPGNSGLGGVIGSGEQSLYDVIVNPGGLLGSLNNLLGNPTTIASVLSAVSSALQPVITNTNVPLPAGVLHAVITPDAQATDGDSLTQTTLSVEITGLGQPLLSGALARAHVTAAAAGCSPVPPVPQPTTPPRPGPTTPGVDVELDASVSVAGRFSSPFAAAAMQCTDVRLRLIDVRPAGKRTLIQGVAEKDFVGKTASIFLTFGNKKVGKATVKPDGTFSATVPLPAAKIRGTNAARYYAVISGKRTAALKFARRMFTTKLSSSGNKVTFAGFTTTPRAKRQKAVKIQERVTCTKYKTVASVKPDAKGRFKVTFAAPVNASTVVYRAQTSVPRSARSKTLFATYTLPTVLAL